MSGDESKLWKSYQRIIDQSKKLEDKTKDSKRTSQESFGSQAVGMMNRYAASVVSVGAALGTVSKLISEVQRRSAELAASQQASFAGMGELAQLSVGKGPEEDRRLKESARALYMQGAATDLTAAADLQFAITSAGMDRYTREIGELRASGVMKDVVAMVNAAAALEASLGTEATGGFKTTVSRAFGASMGAPARAEEITSAAALAGPQAKRLGLSAEELMAAVATLAKPSGSASQAGTFIEALTKSIEKEGIVETGLLKPGRSLEQYVADVAAYEQRGGNVRDILGGRQEAITGYGLLAEGIRQGSYAANLANIAEAERTEAFEGLTQRHRTDPELAAARARQQATARAEIAAAQSGVFSNLAQAISEDMAAAARRRWERFGLGGYAEAGQRFGAAIDRGLGAETFVRRWMGQATPETQEAARTAIEAVEAARLQDERTKYLPKWDAIIGHMERAANNLEASSNRARQRADASVSLE